MSYSRRSRYFRSPSYDRYSKSVSRFRYGSRSWSRSCDSNDVENPGNNLYVTGLSTLVKERDIEEHFSTEGKVEDVHLVVDPWTRGCRGFGFVTMSSVEEADRCIKYLNRSVLEGRLVTVEKARRRRGRTPTPGKYLGLRTVRVRRESPSYSPQSRSCSRNSSESYRRRSRSYSPYRRQERRSYSSYYRGRQRSPSLYYCRDHRYSESPYSPNYSRGRSYSRSLYPYNRRDRSYSPDDCCYRRSRYCDYSLDNHQHDRSYSPDDPYYRRRHYRNYSPDSRDLSYSPDVRYNRTRRYRCYSPDDSYYYRRSGHRSISWSISPQYRRSRRSYSRSASPRWSKRRYSRSISRSIYSRDSYLRSPKRKRSCSVSASSRFVSRSVTPRSSPSS
ncbi:unnamed protein product [Withania somnifera]